MKKSLKTRTTRIKQKEGQIMKKILAGVLCFMALLSFYGCASGGGENTQEDVKTYEMDGMTLDVPESWRYEEGGTGYYYFYPAGADSYSFLMLQNVGFASSIVEDTSYKTYVDGMKSSMEDFTMLSEKTIDSKNLERYRYFSFQATVNSIPIDCESILFDRENGMSYLVMTKGIKTETDYSDDFQNIIESIVVKYEDIDSSSPENSTAESEDTTDHPESSPPSQQSNSKPSSSQSTAPQQSSSQAPANNITTGQQNALEQAHSYLRFSNFSRQGLIDQLLFEGYSQAEAEYAVNNCGADWNAQALGSAKSYLDYSAFSYNGLIHQLEFEGYTTEQATYGANNCGADWNEQAVKSAASYLEYSSFSREGLISQLEFEGFTYEQAVYGVTANGY